MIHSTDTALSEANIGEFDPLHTPPPQGREGGEFDPSQPPTKKLEPWREGCDLEKIVKLTPILLQITQRTN